LGNEIANKLPSSAEEGWLRGKEKVAKPPYPAQTGWWWSTDSWFDQHHPSRRYRVGFPLLG